VRERKHYEAGSTDYILHHHCDTAGTLCVSYNPKSSANMFGSGTCNEMVVLIASFVSQQTIGIVAGGRLRPSSKQTM
jgi:hypothetical protein